MNQPHREYLHTAFVFSGALTIVSVPLAILAGIVANMFLGEATIWQAVFGALFLGALVVAYVIVDSVRVAQWIVLEQVVTDINRRNAETDAISDAMERGSVVQNNIAAPGATIKASVKAPRITVLGKRVSWIQFTAIKNPRSEPRRIEIPREDWVWMLEQFIKAGHSRRLFASERLPYSGLPCYPYLYQLLIDDLCEAEAIQGRGIGTKGALTVKDLGALTKIVDSSHPRGVVLELPSGENESNEA